MEKKNYPIIDVPSNGKPYWMEGAYTLAFVYSKNNGNFILRGYRGEVEKYLEEHYTHYFVYWSMWHQGQSRGHWKFWKENVGIFEPSKAFKSWKYSVRPYSFSYANEEEHNEVRKKELKFKRMPHHWIPEFDKF